LILIFIRTTDLCKNLSHLGERLSDLRGSSRVVSNPVVKTWPWFGNRLLGPTNNFILVFQTYASGASALLNESSKLVHTPHGLLSVRSSSARNRQQSSNTVALHPVQAAGLYNALDV